MRTYFYTIDSGGRIFHEGSELTDRDFLAFFLSRLRENDTGKYPNCRYLSPCGKEMNFVETEHYPIVFRKFENGKLQYGPDLYLEFHPEDLRFDANGNLLHPFSDSIWGRISQSLLLHPDWEWKEREPDSWILIWENREYSISKI
ncbi:DUF4505 family protein [Leptospira wolffii]|uniref:DUF4505 family protein n=1 Tax=Leptospira wolffii TaxID=409998 RepID=A0ABV5BQX6_9LEPT|nr:DUF4505 family protein [Leptospira wolffii]EPG67053.1 hypothetical protein LEP1GSC061_1826 [Leptospira wolffii serovar Khorat str. Khorat-H2]TGL53923.1 DUF4505 domain-containing protein [Leptospira wolffii]